MNNQEKKKALIAALLSGDLKLLKKVVSNLNPNPIEIDKFYAVYVDGQYTGEAYEIDGTPLEVDFFEEIERNDDEMPFIGTIIITIPNKQAMLDNLEWIRKMA